MSGAFFCDYECQGSANAAAKIVDVTDARLPSENPNRKKQGRGRGRGTGRGRGSKAVDQARQTSTSSVTVSNGQHDKLINMVCHAILFSRSSAFDSPMVKVTSFLALELITSLHGLKWSFFSGHWSVQDIA
jgi:hypothetical protein